MLSARNGYYEGNNRRAGYDRECHAHLGSQSDDEEVDTNARADLIRDGVAGGLTAAAMSRAPSWEA